MKVQYAARSDVGRKRTLNEDFYSVFPEQALYVVADGMGGHAAGEVASRLAVETLEEFMVIANQDEEITWPFDLDETLDEDANKLKTAIRLANQKIYQAALKQQRLEGMGTTIVCLLARNGRAYVAHVGDSRGYLLRAREMRPVTSDHSWVNIQVLLGTISREEAQNHPMKNIITRALGTGSDVEVDISVRDLRAEDIYVLCSDGLSGMLSDVEIRDTILSANGDIELAAERLIANANQRGGDDNITVIVARFVAEESKGDVDGTEVTADDLHELDAEGEIGSEDLLNDETLPPGRTKPRLRSIEDISTADTLPGVRHPWAGSGGASLPSSPPLTDDEDVEESIDDTDA
ncbi:MAG: Stp1/IreP family PP2C-type Ser/Thr phosphatase [Candidatus Schekmanbacteria bacterium]|nr:Stp1/IreP family PP2C-type Ser/Thr phosphatase [Candidatus Schekmanbacteria bacterium]